MGKPASMVILLLAATSIGAETREFCLDGTWDLGARYQGKTPGPGERVPAHWCVVTEDDGDRVLFRARGKANPDLGGSWVVAYDPPDRVRIVNRDDPPDIEFDGASVADEARRVRRLDPGRLFDEITARGNAPDGLDVRTSERHVVEVLATADLPLRGRVPVRWQWRWDDETRPHATLSAGDDVIFEADGRYRSVPPDEARDLWSPTDGIAPVQVPGDAWPARIDMQWLRLADGVHLVRGVRTGFQHLVVETSDGLVVADAPAGWVELHQLPPADLVPGLGISGLSERLVDFLLDEFPGRRIAAVAITHGHDDHAGGARAFAAESATIYAPGELREFLSAALMSDAMPRDRLSGRDAVANVVGVDKAVDIGTDAARVRLLPLGPGPHADAMLGVWAVNGGYFFVSDVHVPNSDADVPRAERAATECWFAAWAVDHLPADVVVVNSHSTATSPVSRLRKYLDSDLC